jgi:hypothetical protein
VLVVDARHAGLFAGEDIRSMYLAKYGDPQTMFGCASVWIVGPTVGHCERLGGGEP